MHSVTVTANVSYSGTFKGILVYFGNSREKLSSFNNAAGYYFFQKIL